MVDVIIVGAGVTGLYAANKREWIDTHSLMAGKTMKEDECLPYLFQKLIDKKL